MGGTAGTDIANEWLPEIQHRADLQGFAKPDYTSLFTVEVLRVRNMDAVNTPLDSNTECERRWDGNRATP